MTGDASDDARLETDPDPTEDVYPDCSVVDAHVHVMETGLFESIADWFDRNTEWTVPALDTATVVERISRRTDGVVCFPYAHRPGIADGMNEAVAHWQRKLDVAVGLGTVHTGDDDPDVIVKRAFDRGLCGIKLHCPVQGFPPDDAKLDPVYERLVERDAPLVIHASSHPFYRGSTDLGPERVRNVLERFPGLRICIPHLGLFETSGFLDLADEYAIHFDTAVTLGPTENGVIDLREDELPLNRLREYDDRIMFGSDYPIRPLPYEEALRGVADAFPDAVEDVFFGNACDFYGIAQERVA